MIFLTVGSHIQPFNRLVRKVDELVREGKLKNVYGQVGYSEYKPKHFEYEKFLNEKEFGELVKKSEVIISHAGAGTILNAIKEKKKIIIVPRLEKFKEHNNDHQLEIAEQMDKEGYCILVKDVEQLEEALKRVEKLKAGWNSGKELVQNLKGYIHSI